MNKLIISAATTAIAASLTAGLSYAKAGGPDSAPSKTQVTTEVRSETTTGDKTDKQLNFSVTVSRDGKETRINQDADGIRVAYPGKDGEKIEVTAKDEAELKSKAPEAYAIYQKYVRSSKPTTAYFPEGNARTFVFPRGEFRQFGGPETFRVPPQMDEQSRKQMEDAIRRSQDELRSYQDRLRNYQDQVRSNPFGRNGDSFWQGEGAPATQPSKYRLGIQAAEPSEDLVAQLGKGLVVADVMAESRAAKIGLQKHDLIRAINGKEISNVSKLREAMKDAGDNGKIKIEITRSGQGMLLEEK